MNLQPYSFHLPLAIWFAALVETLLVFLVPPSVNFLLLLLLLAFG